MPTTLTEKEILAFLEEATQSLPGSLAHTTDLRALEGWDSMGMVMFMGLVHEKGGTELSVHDLRECADVGALTTLVAARQRA